MDIHDNSWSNLVTYTDNLFYDTDWRQPLNTYDTTINTFIMLAMNRFKWECEYLNPKHRAGKLIEYYLATRGQAFIVKSTGDVLQGYMTKSYDKFGNPKGFYCYGFNGESDGKTQYKYDDVIWIKNNALCIPSLYWIYKYSNRINTTEGTMDLNIQAQKTPYIIEADPLIAESLRIMFDQIDKLSKVVIVDKAKSLIDNIKVLKLDVPYLADKLYDQKINEQNELLHFFGIDTVQEKNAHMLYAEVQNSNEITDNYTDIFVSERRIAVQQAKESGIDIKLSILDIQPDMQDLNGGEDNVENTDNFAPIN